MKVGNLYVYFIEPDALDNEIGLLTKIVSDPDRLLLFQTKVLIGRDAGKTSQLSDDGAAARYTRQLFWGKGSTINKLKVLTKKFGRVTLEQERRDVLRWLLQQ